MKAITHESLHHGFTNERRVSTTPSEECKKSRQGTGEVETTVWVLIVLFFALVLLSGYLFWNKF